MGVIAETADRVAVLYAGRLARSGPVRDVITSPSTLYRGLMGSIPDLMQESDRLVQIPGAMPRLNAIPSGCAFNPRCDKVMARCRVESPDGDRPQRWPKGRCWLYDEAAAEVALAAPSSRSRGFWRRFDVSKPGSTG